MSISKRCLPHVGRTLESGFRKGLSAERCHYYSLAQIERLLDGRRWLSMRSWLSRRGVQPVARDAYDMSSLYLRSDIDPLIGDMRRHRGMS